MIFKIARYEVRPEARDEVERAIHEFASYVQAELAGSSWTTYRDRDNPNRYVSFISADDEEADERHRKAPGTRRFVEVLYPRLVGGVEFTDWELVAASR